MTVCLSGVDLLMVAKLMQQQETTNLQFISRKLQTRKKFKEMKTRRKSKVRKSKSVNNLLSSDIGDDVPFNVSECSSEGSRSVHSGRCSLDSVSLEETISSF